MWEYLKKAWPGLLAAVVFQGAAALWEGYRQEQETAKLKKDLKKEILDEMKTKESE